MSEWLKTKLIHTASPLQYGLSLNRVLGAHTKIQTPKNDMHNPQISWNINNTLANKGYFISNGFGRREAEKNNENFLLLFC